MRAARDFADRLEPAMLSRVTRLSCMLFGSLGATGIGHGTPDAIVAGLSGMRPEDCDPAAVRGAWSTLPKSAVGHGSVLLAGIHPVDIARDDIGFAPFTRLPGHPNAMTLHAWGRDESGAEHELYQETYYSVGGGFIRRASEDAAHAAAAHSAAAHGGADRSGADRASGTLTLTDTVKRTRAVTEAATPRHPLPYSSSEELLALCEQQGISLADIARANEEAVHGREALDAGLDAIWAAMHSCVEHGLATPRRAAGRPRRQAPGARGARAARGLRRPAACGSATPPPSGCTPSPSP